MAVLFNSKNDLKSCEKVKKEQHLAHAKCMLGYISRAINTPIYMVDVQKRQVIMSNLAGHTVAGLPVEAVRRDGLKFYDKILSDSEKEWKQKMQVAADKVIAKNYDSDLHMDFVFSYDLQANTPNGREVTLHHRFVPYQRDEDEKLWLGLCAISALPLTCKTSKACLDCVETGERYDYIDDKFVLSPHKHLTEEEIAILGYLADGVALKQISAKVDLSLRVVERKKKEALDKLNAPTQAAAVYKAKSMGLI